MFRLCWIILTWSFTLTVQIDLGDELLKNMVTTTESPSTSEFQCANGFRIPWLLTCEGTNHCTDGSDEDPAMCLPRTCPMGFPYKCVASGRCLSELWLCDGQKDCPDGADENQIACKHDPLLLLQRIMRKMRTHKPLRNSFGDEMSPVPLSLFEKSGFMRIGRKAKLYNIFDSILNVDNIFEKNASFIVDGGYLIHNVVWPSNVTYKSIFETYITFVKKHYGNKCTIIFDGYVNLDTTLRSPERRRRQQRKIKYDCMDLQLNDTNEVQVPQEDFLSNYENKARLIEILTKKLLKSGVNVMHAEDDADLLIVHTSIGKARDGQTVYVVGQDVDLFVLLLTFSTPSARIMFHRAGKGSKQSRTYCISTLKKKFAYLIPHLLFIHAISGCDTTSSVFDIGKLKHLQTYHDHPELHDGFLKFNNKSSSHFDLLRVGEEYLMRLYGAPKIIKSLNTNRYIAFSKFVVASKERVELSRLPPTSEAAKQHIYRTFLQVQLWHGNVLNPLEWGWEKDNNMIRPIFTRQPSKQDFLPKLIIFACTNLYQQHYGHIKSGVKFSIICKHCQELSRLNNSSFVDKIIDDMGNNHTILNN